MGWFWRWGVPAMAGSATVAAVVLAVPAFLELEWSTHTWPTYRLREATIGAGSCAAVLWAAWLLAGRSGPGAALSANGVRDSGKSLAVSLVAAATVATAIALAAHNLDHPLRGNERITIVDYATQPFAVAISKYEAPNNHVLHTMLVWTAHQLGGWNRVVLRMPAFIAFCFLLPALWWFARNEYGSTAAAFATVFVGTSPIFIEYATNARGYTLMLLFFMVAMLCGQALVRSPDRRALWGLWAAALGLGFFTIPLMGFPATATAAWMLLSRWRRYGREGLASFAAKTAAWSGAALLLALVLYTPILATEGISGVREAMPPQLYPREAEAFARMLQVLAHPGWLWGGLHSTHPAWVPGVLLALAATGCAAPGRTCGRSGSFPVVIAVAVCAGLLARPFLPTPRMVLWALLLLMITAGAGAAVVVEACLTRAGARWPGTGGGTGRTVSRCLAVGLALVVFAWLATRPGVAIKRGRVYAPAPVFPAMISAVAEQAGPGERMRPGDHFTIHPILVIPALTYLREFHRVHVNAGWFLPVRTPRRRWPIHLLDVPPGRERRPARLFLFDDTDYYYPARRFLVEDRLPREFMTEHWPDHEVVAAFSEGRVYMMGN